MNTPYRNDEIQKYLAHIAHLEAQLERERQLHVHAMEGAATELRAAQATVQQQAAQITALRAENERLRASRDGLARTALHVPLDLAVSRIPVPKIR